MKLQLVKFSFFILCILLIQNCKEDNREGVSKSRTFIFHYDIETEHLIKSYMHYIYIGNYTVKTKADTLFLLNKAMEYVDSVRYATPVTGIVFVNSIDDFPTSIDDQDADKIREKTIFSVFFSEDSLLKSKYHIDEFHTWKNGKMIVK
ncbi:hypothetical protein [Flectobacillus major]|uniref:hypothetical protein n=1 Tax=Flectobacillus major TaxID=103 RepID=UPI00047E4C7D|nr:hypothetical protein [Flectobacillus major]